MPGRTDLTERLWRLLPDVRGHEQQRFGFFAGLSLLVSAAQTLGLVGVEALFLARFGAALLPETFIAASLLTVAGSFAYAVVVGRARNDTLFIWMLWAAVAALAAAGAAAASGANLALPGLFCLWYLIQAVFLNHFFTFVVDYFDGSASKRMFPLFTIAASLGGAAGGGLGVWVTRSVGPEMLIAGWAALFAACALVLRLARRRLRRWGPMELEEADETSVEGIQGALHYLRSSPLARALVVSALGMVLALFVAQYLYSDLFVRAFPDASDLASFLGLYLAVTNVAEIGLGLVVTPFLIRRFGVASANLIHPLLTLLSFGGLAAHQGLSTAIATRVNRELVDNATGFPIRSLVYNAMPVRLRGRMRAFLEGIVVYAGMSAAGVLLLLLDTPDPRVLCVAGGLAALVFLFANLAARRAYVRDLVSQLRTGRLDLRDIGDEIGSWETEQLASLWEEMLRTETRRPSRSLLEMIPQLASRDIVAPLIRALSHPSGEVRRSCLVALAPHPGEAVDAAVRRALADGDPRVRLAALRAAARRGSGGLGELLEDPAPEVRAEACIHAGGRGVDELRRMLAGDVSSVVAALAVAPPELLGAARERLHDAEPAIRAAAFEALARMAAEPPLTEEAVLAAAADPDARVRRAALGLLANLDSEKALTALAGTLADPSVDVARTAQTLLGALGDEGAEAAAPHLHSESERAVEGALRVHAAVGAQGRLQAHLRACVRQLWWDLAAYQYLSGEQPSGAGALADRFLQAAFQDAMMRDRRTAFLVLQLLEDPAVIHRVERSLRLGSRRLRGDALEVLSNLGDRVSGQLLVLMHETGPLPDRLRAVARLVQLPGSLEQVIDASLRSELHFVRMGARAVAFSDREMTHEEDTMKRLLALQQVPLFEHLSLEQLDAVLRVTREEDFQDGEVICREGDPGGVLYLIVEGSVRIYKSHGTPAEHLLSTIAAVSYFGEMAILDDEPRSATAVAAGGCRVLCLDGASLKELILQMPQISFEIFRVLTSRVRAAEARLGDR